MFKERANPFAKETIGTWAAEVYPYLLNAFDYFDPSNGYLKLKNGEITGTAGTDLSLIHI